MILADTFVWQPRRLDIVVRQPQGVPMHMRHIASVGVLVLAIAGCEPQPADRDLGGNNVVEPDNTKVNQQDREADTKTPFDQAENGSDIATTAAIRREILKTDGLSTN